MPPADAPSGRPGGALLPLLVALSVAGYGLLAWWFPLGDATRTPPADVRTFAPSLPAGLLYAVLLVVLYALYLAAYRRVAADERALPAWRGRPLLALLVVALLLALPLLFVYPVNATDVFRYVIRGRVAAVYEASPYAAPPAAFLHDKFLPLAGEWAGETSPYGPLWELVAAGLAGLGGDDLRLAVLLFKLLVLGCFLGGGALIWALLAGRTGRAALALLWLWNPALLLTFLVNGHNDALMLMWLLLGLWLAKRGRPTLGFLVMCLAALTKPVAVLVLPIFFIAFWRGAGDGRARLRFGVAAVLGAMALMWLAFLPWAEAGRFWQTPLDLTLRLAREATASAGFSPGVWLYFALGQRVPIQTIGDVLRAAFLLWAGWVLWRTWRGRPALRGAADVLAGYLAQALSFRIWYAVWPFPWLLLDAPGPDEAARVAYRLRAGLWFLLTAQLSVVWYGHMRAYLLGGDQVIAHLIGVPLVFGLPWLLARWPITPSQT